jgi:flagellar M-ring protein FliF
MEPLNRLLAQLRTYWAGLSGVRRVLIVGAAAAVFVGVAGFAYLSQGGEYVPLYAESLPTEEVADLEAKLRAANLPYKLKDPHTVLVPRERHPEITVAMAGVGVPVRGGKGFELFDETSLTATPFSQSVNYQRALQAELARAVTQIQGVAAARVLIARPDPTPFLRDRAEPTASVVVKLKPNAGPGKSLAASIVSLVSRAVVGLKAESVTVVDSTGRLLSDPHAGEKESLPTTQIEYRRELESYLAGKAQDMLTAHLGAGRAVVKVSADVNFQKVKERQERYSPDEKVVTAERLINSSSSGGRAGGIAGTGSNIRQAGGSGGAGTSSREETIQTDYLASKTVRELEDRMGAVTRLSVAVLADLSPPPAADSQPARPSLSVEDAQEIVKQAVGFLPTRDVIKLSNVPLGGPVTAVEPDEEEAQIRRLAAYVALARNVSLAVAVVTALALIPLFLLRRRRRAADPVPLQVAPPDPARQRRERVERFLELARTDPDRTAAVFGLLAGPPNG